MHSLKQSSLRLFLFLQCSGLGLIQNLEEIDFLSRCVDIEGLEGTSSVFLQVKYDSRVSMIKSTYFFVLLISFMNTENGKLNTYAYVWSMYQGICDGSHIQVKLYPSYPPPPDQ